MGWNPAGATSGGCMHRGAAVEADAIGEQQFQRMQSGSSSSSSRCNQGAAAVPADAIREQQQFQQMQSGSSSSSSGCNQGAAAVPADAIREQQWCAGNTQNFKRINRQGQ